MSEKDAKLLFIVLEMQRDITPDMLADDGLEALRKRLEDYETIAGIFTRNHQRMSELEKAIDAASELPHSERATNARKYAAAMRRILNDPDLPMALVAFEDDVIFGD